MPSTLPTAPIRFHVQYVERPWAGNALAAKLGQPAPPDRKVGEAWLLSDHSHYPSVVHGGPLNGNTLRQLVDRFGSDLLGTRSASQTERFPMLLKLLDVAEWLSVQVHPTDALAKSLGEADGGKTEMWHVLEAEPSAELLCGLRAEVTLDPDSPPEADEWPDILNRFIPSRGDSFYVPAGAIHAIGPGLVLAEIQQTSDITYRLHDWGRSGPDGPRELHLDRGVKVASKTKGPEGRPEPVVLSPDRALLCACPFFAAERIEPRNTVRTFTADSFHIVLGIDGTVTVTTESGSETLNRGEAALIPACAQWFSLDGPGAALDYFVPDLTALTAELRARGCPPGQLRALGCEQAED